MDIYTFSPRQVKNVCKVLEICQRRPSEYSLLFEIFWQRIQRLPVPSCCLIIFLSQESGIPYLTLSKQCI